MHHHHCEYQWRNSRGRLADEDFNAHLELLETIFSESCAAVAVRHRRAYESVGEKQRASFDLRRSSSCELQLHQKYVHDIAPAEACHRRCCSARSSAAASCAREGHAHQAISDNYHKKRDRSDGTAVASS